METLCSVYKVHTLPFDYVEHPLLCLQFPITLLFDYKFPTLPFVYTSGLFGFCVLTVPVHHF